MANDPARQARDVIARLRQEGHHAAADHLSGHMLDSIERHSLSALREVCNTILTAIEAIDPVTQMMIEELRLEVEKRLRSSDPEESAR